MQKIVSEFGQKFYLMFFFWFDLFFQNIKVFEQHVGMKILFNKIHSIFLKYWNLLITASTHVLECCGAYTEKGMKCLICYGVNRKLIALILLLFFKWNSMKMG